MTHRDAARDVSLSVWCCLRLAPQATQILGVVKWRRSIQIPISAASGDRGQAACRTDQGVTQPVCAPRSASLARFSDSGRAHEGGFPRCGLLRLRVCRVSPGRGLRGAPPSAPTRSPLDPRTLHQPSLNSAQRKPMLSSRKPGSSLMRQAARTLLASRPGTAPEDADGGRFTFAGPYGRYSVGTPLPHVPQHVVKTPGVGTLLSHRPRAPSLELVLLLRPP